MVGAMMVLDGAVMHNDLLYVHRYIVSAIHNLYGMFDFMMVLHNLYGMVNVIMVLRNKCCTGSLWRSCASHDLLGAHRCIISADHNLYGMVGVMMVL